MHATSSYNLAGHAIEAKGPDSFRGKQAALFVIKLQ
jgi:hypothetical protein